MHIVEVVTIKDDIYNSQACLGLDGWVGTKGHQELDHVIVAIRTCDNEQRCVAAILTFPLVVPVDVEDAGLDHGLDKSAWVNVAFPFGELYSRNILDLKTRELCTIAALTVQGFALPQLKLHIRAAIRCGASRPEVAEVITQMTAYCGFPAATNALLIMKDVFDDESKQEE